MFTIPFQEHPTIPQQRLEIEFSQLALEQNRNPACIAGEIHHTLSDHFQVAAQVDCCAPRCLRTDFGISCMLEYVTRALKLIAWRYIQPKIIKIVIFCGLFR